MKILDWYILKRYLLTFFVMLLMFIPIGIVVDLSEKVDKMLDKKAPLSEILAYYDAHGDHCHSGLGDFVSAVSASVFSGGVDRIGGGILYGDVHRASRKHGV